MFIVELDPSPTTTTRRICGLFGDRIDFIDMIDPENPSTWTKIVIDCSNSALCEGLLAVLSQEIATMREAER